MEKYFMAGLVMAGMVDCDACPFNGQDLLGMCDGCPNKKENDN